jgi:hypothetical protein
VQVLKQRQLCRLGWRLASVPYFEWDEVRGDRTAAAAYVRRRVLQC